MRSILQQAKCLTAEVLSDGSIAVDATLGNGYDAVHMAEHIAPSGQLFGVDIQEEAVANARERLSARGLINEAILTVGDHARLQELVPSELIGRVDAVMFNLGYLPGGDHTITTEAETTIPALGQAVDLLRPGGRMTAVVYRGHEGAEAEYQAVLDWAETLDQRTVEVLHYRFINQIHNPPELLAFEKQSL